MCSVVFSVSLAVKLVNNSDHSSSMNDSYSLEYFKVSLQPVYVPVARKENEIFPFTVTKNN